MTTPRPAGGVAGALVGFTLGMPAALATVGTELALPVLWTLLATAVGALVGLGAAAVVRRVDERDADLDDDRRRRRIEAHRAVARLDLPRRTER